MVNIFVLTRKQGGVHSTSWKSFLKRIIVNSELDSPKPMSLNCIELFFMTMIPSRYKTSFQRLQDVSDVF